jgi:hypothetical protein
MAVGTPIIGTPSGANGAALTVAFPIGMGIVANDIVVMYAVFYANSGTVPTVINWTSGLTGAPATWTWTQGELVTVKDGSGVAKGVAGWAWARATGSFSGSCGNITANGTSGANSGSLMNSVKIPGCVTSGDPFEDKDFLNPNNTTTVDFPACDMARSSGGMSLLLFCHTDNINIGTPTNWTAVASGSNGSTQGLDSGVDADYRIPGATGTYDPATVSFTAGNNLGWATFHIIFTDTAGGPTTHFGVTSLPITFNRVVAGTKKTFSTLAMPITFGAVTQGRRKVFSQVLFPITFDKVVSGQRKTFSQLAFPITFGKAVSGQRKTFSQLSFPITFGKAISGRKTTFGQLAFPIVFGKAVNGQRKTFSQLSLPITFGKTVSGYRTTFSQFSLPITVSIFTTGEVSTGPVTHFGELTMPVTFGKNIVGQRKTFSQVIAPFIFTITSDGQRHTFSALELPITLNANVESGRVEVHGVIDLDFILDINTDGSVKLAGMILNEALALYLGETEVLAVYVGSEQVW